MPAMEFGSRAGTWGALGLFAIVFGALAWGVTREIRRRSGVSPMLTRVAGLVVFAGPILLIYSSSLTGFYEARLDQATLHLDYLFPGMTRQVPITQVSSVAPVAWYRGRWRLDVTTTGGRRYESATASREAVANAASRLNRFLKESASLPTPR